MTYRLVADCFSTGGVAVLERAASLSLVFAAVPLVAEGVPGFTPKAEVVGTVDEEGCGVNGLF